MTLQRQVSPIPPGRYWITVLGDNIREFDSWVADMAGAVVLESSSLDRAELPHDPFGRHTGPPAQFVIFRVPEGRAPFLNAIQFGFPSLAPPNVKDVRDVEQTPNPEDLPNPFGLPDLSGIAGMVLLALVLSAASQAGSLFGGGGRRARRLLS